jgi:hypothetical protein
MRKRDVIPYTGGMNAQGVVVAALASAVVGLAGIHSARAATTPVLRQCHHVKARAAGPNALVLTVNSERGTTCANAKKVFTLVSGWADRFAPDLGASKHTNTLGYRCVVDQVGDAYWNLRCTRGTHVIRATTAG